MDEVHSSSHDLCFSPNSTRPLHSLGPCGPLTMTVDPSIYFLQVTPFASQPRRLYRRRMRRLDPGSSISLRHIFTCLINLIHFHKNHLIPSFPVPLQSGHRFETDGQSSCHADTLRNSIDPMSRYISDITSGRQLAASRAASAKAYGMTAGSNTPVFLDAQSRWDFHTHTHTHTVRSIKSQIVFHRPKALQQQSCYTHQWESYPNAHVELHIQRVATVTIKLYNLSTLYIQCLSRQASPVKPFWTTSRASSTPACK